MAESVARHWKEPLFLLRLAEGRLRRVAHRSTIGFALNRARLRRATLSHERDAIIRAWPPDNDDLMVALSKATFFVLGKEVERYPELARELLARGHELGNHSFSHRNPLTLSEIDLTEEFERAATSIEAATGRRPLTLRPPWGNRAAELARNWSPRGVATVLWAIDSGDTVGFTADRVGREVIANVRSGDVVLMHDGGDERPATLAATARILEKLGGRGYRFVTVSELLAHGERVDV